MAPRTRFSLRRMAKPMFFSLTFLLLMYYLHYLKGPPSSRNAYVFYATQDSYACSVLINLFTLRHVFYTRYRVIILVSDDVSTEYQEAFINLGATVIKGVPPPLHTNSIAYYQGCLLKLLAFGLVDEKPPLKRIIVMDSDQLILRNLDHAFELPLASISAPKAYWIDNHTFTSTFMAFKPSQRLWSDVRRAILRVPADTYDMDIMNNLFQDVFEELPGTYSTLNSHWEDINTPPWFISGEDQKTKPTLDRTLRELFSRVHVLHFTAVGKPWMYDVEELRARRPEAHPILVEQWAFWRTSALELCPSRIIDHV